MHINRKRSTGELREGKQRNKTKKDGWGSDLGASNRVNYRIKGKLDKYRVTRKGQSPGRRHRLLLRNDSRARQRQCLETVDPMPIGHCTSCNQTLCKITTSLPSTYCYVYQLFFHRVTTWCNCVKPLLILSNRHVETWPECNLIEYMVIFSRRIAYFQVEQFQIATTYAFNSYNPCYSVIP